MTLSRFWSRLRRAPASSARPAHAHAEARSRAQPASYRTWAVEIVVLRGSGRPVAVIEGRVPAPTVGQALAVLNAGAAAALSDPAQPEAPVERPDVDFGVVRLVAADWLPADIAADVLALADVALARVLASAVAETAEIPARRPADDDADAAPMTWDRVVIEVARAYGWTVAGTRAMEWPDFVAASAAVPALRAADTLRAAEAALAPHIGEDGLRSMFARLEALASGHTAPADAEPAVQPWERTGQTRDAYMDELRERARGSRRALLALVAERDGSPRPGAPATDTV